LPGVPPRFAHTCQNMCTLFLFQGMDYDLYRRKVEATGCRGFMNGDPAEFDDEIDADATGILEMMSKVIEEIHGDRLI
jgi:hypothetical protein